MGYTYSVIYPQISHGYDEQAIRNLDFIGRYIACVSGSRVENIDVHVDRKPIYVIDHNGTIVGCMTFTYTDEWDLSNPIFTIRDTSEDIEEIDAQALNEFIDEFVITDDAL